VSLTFPLLKTIIKKGEEGAGEMAQVVTAPA
jgi:hypothetical protein